jgi:hypothetical protein
MTARHLLTVPLYLAAPPHRLGTAGSDPMGDIVGSRACIGRQHNSWGSPPIFRDTDGCRHVRACELRPGPQVTAILILALTRRILHLVLLIARRTTFAVARRAKRSRTPDHTN